MHRIAILVDAGYLFAQGSAESELDRLGGPVLPAPAIDNRAQSLTLRLSEGCRPESRLRRKPWVLPGDPNPSNLIRVMPAKGLDVCSPL